VEPLGTGTPSRFAPWGLIRPFAQRFNGYDFFGSLRSCGIVANTLLQLYLRDRKLTEASLGELRSSLFFEARRYHHYGWDPTPEEMPYIWSLIEAIRECVRRGDLDLHRESELTQHYAEHLAGARQEDEQDRRSRERYAERERLLASRPSLKDIKGWIEAHDPR
jgi:hypothetical protein